MPDDITRRSLTITTSDGVALEAERVAPAGASSSVVLTHPHPLHGGSMQSLVTSELFRQLPAAGTAVLRFNFHGVEGSGGTHGAGVDETHDVVAAIDALERETNGDLPMLVAGWSFGADVALSVTDARLDGWFLAAPPLRVIPLELMTAASDPRPKLLVVPEHDQFRPPASAREVTADWTNTTIEVIAGADHFLVGRTDRVAALLREHLSAITR